MARRTSKSRGCKACRRQSGGRSCEAGHVYVIELGPGADDDRSFHKKAKKLRGATGDRLYVGQTTHTVECRLRQHLGEAGEGTGFSCRCSDRDQSGSRGNRWVKKHGGTLRYDLFTDWNPLDRDPEDAEKELGLELKRAGHIVYWK